MRFNLLIILTGQGHISEVIVLSKVSKGTFDVVLNIVPLLILDVLEMWY